MPNNWVMIESGKRWRLMQGEKILGFVVWAFDGWDGFICTGEKWPNGSKQVRQYKRTHWAARQAVEFELMEG